MLALSHAHEQLEHARARLRERPDSAALLLNVRSLEKHLRDLEEELLHTSAGTEVVRGSKTSEGPR